MQQLLTTLLHCMLLEMTMLPQGGGCNLNMDATHRQGSSCRHASPEHSQHRFLFATDKLSCMCRLNTVLTCNRVLVLNAGAVEEFDAPQRLLQVCVLCGGLARCLACFRLAVPHLFRLRPQPKINNASLLPFSGPLNTSAATILSCDAHLTPVFSGLQNPHSAFYAMMEQTNTHHGGH